MEGAAASLTSLHQTLLQTCFKMVSSFAQDWHFIGPTIQAAAALAVCHMLCNVVQERVEAAPQPAPAAVPSDDTSSSSAPETPAVATAASTLAAAAAAAVLTMAAAAAGGSRGDASMSGGEALVRMDPTLCWWRRMCCRIHSAKSLAVALSASGLHSHLLQHCHGPPPSAADASSRRHAHKPAPSSAETPAITPDTDPAVAELLTVLVSSVLLSSALRRGLTPAPPIVPAVALASSAVRTLGGPIGAGSGTARTGSGALAGVGSTSIAPRTLLNMGSGLGSRNSNSSSSSVPGLGPAGLGALPAPDATAAAVASPTEVVIQAAVTDPVPAAATAIPAIDAPSPVHQLCSWLVATHCRLCGWDAEVVDLELTPRPAEPEPSPYATPRGTLSGTPADSVPVAAAAATAVAAPLRVPSSDLAHPSGVTPAHRLPAAVISGLLAVAQLQRGLLDADHMELLLVTATAAMKASAAAAATVAAAIAAATSVVGAAAAVAAAAGGANAAQQVLWMEGTAAVFEALLEGSGDRVSREALLTHGRRGEEALCLHTQYIHAVYMDGCG